MTNKFDSIYFIQIIINLYKYYIKYNLHKKNLADKRIRLINTIKITHINYNKDNSYRSIIRFLKKNNFFK